MSSKLMEVQTPIQPLNKQEIDRRIQGLVDCVAEEAVVIDAEDYSPRWVDAADLVRRMRPFLCLN